MVHGNGDTVRGFEETSVMEGGQIPFRAKGLGLEDLEDPI